MATLINGDGNSLVYAQQDADWFKSICGGTTQIMQVGNLMAYELEDANTIAVQNGTILTKEGRRIQIDVGNVDEFTIPTGTQGATNYYIIGYHLYTDGNANQLCETFIQKMADASETIAEATFRSGATEVYISLYRVTQESLAITSVTSLLPQGLSIGGIKDEVDSLNASLTATLTSANWTANSDSATNTLYPYIYTISSSLYSNDSRPVWDCVGTASTGIPTDTELEDIALIQQAYFSTSGVTIYATDQPSGSVVFRSKGA